MKSELLSELGTTDIEQPVATAIRIYINEARSAKLLLFRANYCQI